MKSGDLMMLLLAGGIAYFVWYSMNYSTVVSAVGSAANPITVPNAPAPVLVSTGPLASTPVGPGLSGTWLF